MITRAVLQGAGMLLLAAAAAGLAQRFHPRAPALYLVQEKAPEGAITVREAKALLVSGQPGAIWLDARHRPEFQKGHIPGALLCNDQEWDSCMESVITALDAAPGRPVIIYCDAQKCQASKDIQKRILPLIPDERQVLILHGGWPAWVEAKP